ncbi:MAG: NYN domain-containing protein [Lentisphaerae bacterium]|nr:NYN domain-containing protein [Lentisphaerota bacterium]
MSFLSQLFGTRRLGARKRARSPEERVYLVDATGLVDPRQRIGDQASPRDNFAVLRLLAQFAGREAIEIQAVFTGRPLREAGDGQEFRGVRAFYAESSAATRARIKELIRKLSANKDVLLLTADQALEREAKDLGAPCMRLATFRKSFEERDERERDRDRGSRERAARPDERREREPPGFAEAPSRPGFAGALRPGESALAKHGARAAPEEKPDEEAEPRDQKSPGVLDLIDPI